MSRRSQQNYSRSRI